MATAQQAAIAAMTEANRIVDIDAAALAIHEKAGTSQYLFARTGHGIGLGGHEYPDDMAYNYRPSGGHGVLLRAGRLRAGGGRLPPLRHCHRRRRRARSRSPPSRRTWRSTCDPGLTGAGVASAGEQLAATIC